MMQLTIGYERIVPVNMNGNRDQDSGPGPRGDR